jgi:hypothetical protein
MRRERMPQRVTRRRLRDPGALHGALQAPRNP